MNFFNILLAALCLALIYSIFRDFVKRKNLGSTIMRVRFDLNSYLGLIITSAAFILIVCFTILGYNRYSKIEYYGPVETTWLILNNSVYVLVQFKMCMRIITSRQIREKGLTLSNLAIDYADIRGINWIEENKVRINYDPGSMFIFNRNFKDKWVVPDDQVAELKQHFDNKYYEKFSLSKPQDLSEETRKNVY